MQIPREHEHHILEGETPGWVVPQESAAISTSTMDGAAYPPLLLDTQHNLETNTFYRRRVHYLPNQISVQHGSRLEIEFSPDVEQLILHTLHLRRGEDVIDLRETQSVRVLNREAQMERFIFDGRLLVVFLLNDVRAGDTVDCSYSVQATKQPLFGKLSGRVLLRSTSPAKAIRVRLVYHPDRVVYAQAHNSDCQARTAYTPEGLIECQWAVEDVKAIEAPPHTPSWMLPFQWIDYGEFGSWEEVAAAAHRLYLDPADGLPPHLADWVEKVRATSATPEDFILQIVRYVQDNIRYVAISIDEHTCKPYDVATILDRNYGDCKDKSTLLCRLLQHAGIDARPALVHSGQRSRATEGLPRPGAFDHVIVRLNHANQIQWVDATITNQGGRFGKLSHPGYGVALVLGSPDVAVEKVPLAPCLADITYDEFVKVPQHGGTAELRVTRIFAAASADHIRNQFVTLGLAEMDRLLVADYERAYPSVTIQAPTRFDDDRDENRITIVHQLLLSGIWTRLPQQRLNAARFPVFGIQPVLHLPDPGKRSQAYMVWHPVVIRANLEVRFPAGLVPGQKKGGVWSAAFHCQCFTQTSSNSGRVNLEYKSAKAFVEPGEMAAHEKAIQQLGQLSAFQVTAPEQIVQRGRGPLPRRP